MSKGIKQKYQNRVSNLYFQKGCAYQGFNIGTGEDEEDIKLRIGVIVFQDEDHECLGPPYILLGFGGGRGNPAAGVDSTCGSATRSTSSDNKAWSLTAFGYILVQ